MQLWQPDIYILTVFTKAFGKKILKYLNIQHERKRHDADFAIERNKIIYACHTNALKFIAYYINRQGLWD